MESMNLNNLASSLPTSNLANAEADLLNNFKAAAMSITTLYKSSRRTSKRAYNAGYAAACQDLLLMIQQRVSAGETGSAEGGGMTIGRIMDYIEARLEAIKSTEEEEEEENEKDRERERERERKPSTSASSRPLGSSNTMKPPIPSASGTLRSRDHVASPPLTPLSPPNFTSGSALVRATSPSPSPATSIRTTSISTQRQSKSRLLQLSNASPKETVIAPPASSFAFPTAAVLSTAPDAPLATIPFPSAPPITSISSESVPELAGTKRRHAAMLMESSSSAAPSTPVSSSRRRTRTMRSSAALREPSSPQDQNQNQSQLSDAMDVEEDGRERKRVARR